MLRVRLCPKIKNIIEFHITQEGGVADIYWSIIKIGQLVCDSNLFLTVEDVRNFYVNYEFYRN